MPRCSKRNRPTPTNSVTPVMPTTSILIDDIDSSHHNKRSRNSSSRRHSREEVSFSQKKCFNWFKQYTTPEEPDLLGPEGMERFCQDIGVEPENIVMLIIALKMNAKHMGYFTQEEWVRGLTELQCDSIQRLCNKLEYLRSTLNDPNFFKALYRYSYDFARDRDQRSLDMATARALLAVLMPHWPLRPSLDRFLEMSRYKVLNRDQWVNILEMSRVISNDLSDYDTDGAWPVMLDEFVEWYRQEKSDAIMLTSTS